MVTTRERHGENARVAFAGCTFPTDFLPSLLNIFLLHNSFHFFLFLCFLFCDVKKEREINLSLSLAQQT